MRRGAFNKNKLITIISTSPNGKLNYNSIQKELHIKKTKKNEAPPFVTKTLTRYLKALCEDGYLQKDNNGYYSLTKSHSEISKALTIDTLDKMLAKTLESQAYLSYKQLRNYINDNHINVLDDFQLSKYSETIKEPVHILTDNRMLIQKINNALYENCLIRILYHSKECTLFPVCYVVSRDGTRKYLYGVRKKQLEAKDLREVQFLECMGKANINRKDYINQIQKIWDIDKCPCDLRLLVRKNEKDSPAVIKQMFHYFGKPKKENKDYNIYEGTLIGINDFKTWLRSRMEICIVLQPEWLRKEFITSLREKKERYGESK